jgi:hypothetical protein
LGEAFLGGAAFFWADFAPRLLENAFSHPSAYFWFVPTRVMVTSIPQFDLTTGCPTTALNVPPLFSRI